MPYRKHQLLSVIVISILFLVNCGGNPPPPNSSSSSSSSSSSTSSSNSTSSSSSSSSSTSSSSGVVNPYPPIQNGCSGWASRYWDCCKPHCGWSANTPTEQPLKSCSTNNQPVGINEQSSCGSGDGHMCWELIPFAVSDTLAYGYAAVPASSNDICGKCYQLQFEGRGFHDTNDNKDPGSAALGGKTMIVQATNIGGDVEGGQFDILAPGGGVGLFNACSAQWGVSTNELGAQYGGMLSACKQSLNHQGSLSDNKNCLIKKCNDVFGSRGLTKLQEGCLFYANWFEAADNPALKYKEVQCPAELVNGSGMDRSPLGGINNACGN